MLHPFSGGTIFLLCLALLPSSSPEELHLTTNNQGYLTVIQGFATQLQCILNSCSKTVNWYKDDVLIFNATQFVKESNLKEESFLLQHQVDFDHTKECSSTSCSDSASSCPEGSSCLDNICCPCQREHFTLILKNLTFEDSGRYRCQVGKESELLEFQVEVLESGLRGGFHQNISYDHSACCEEKGISPLCKAMCKPSEMEKFHFDPTSCKTEDYKNFLSCATEGGNRSHVHCCKTQLVPSFCYDLCSNQFTMLRRSHRLCLYYLPEIFDCYNRAYLPYPDPPGDVVVNAVESDKLEVCWKPPAVQSSNKDYPLIDYTVYYKQIPSFPFLGGGNDDGFPLMSSDYSDLLSDYEEHENESVEKRKRDVQAIARDFGFEMEEKEETNLSRKKRQTFVFVAKDDSTNTSTVREFNFNTMTTTETCATIADLRSATRYIVYVTSRNGYGSSVPSIRSIASTNIISISSNATLPDTMKCCTSNGVSSYCSTKMCTVDSEPSSIAVLSIATSCRAEWPKVSPCIADGRNHTDCCVRKGVHKDCLGICGGSVESLGAHSVLCLNLDLSAIYQCLREGYETHPSPPINVKVVGASERTARIEWEEPETNAHLVSNYTLFIRKNQHGETVRTVENAVSPHIEMDLDPDSSYSVSVQSHSEKGVSLPSTTVLFQTRADKSDTCQYGDVLTVSDGRPIICELPNNPCPIHYTCTDSEEDPFGDAFCCPNAPSALSFEQCCSKLGVTPDCLTACNHNSTGLPEWCGNHLNHWIQCASDAHDHSRCCHQEEVSKECLSACSHPFTVEPTCITESAKLARCFSTHHSMIPQAVRNIQVESVNATSVSLKWDSTPNMKEFELQLFTDGSIFNRTNTTTPSISLSILSPSTRYTARVIAFNDAGSAPPSFNITFTTLGSLVDSTEPMAPRGLHIIWNRGNRVNMSWEGVEGRMGGGKMETPASYTLYFVDNEKDGQWQTIRTNSTWAVMGDLRKDAIYSVYVTASEGPEGATSLASNILTLIAQEDSFGLPEPTISISPARSDWTYPLGETLTINCSVDGKRLSSTNVNLDLTIGDMMLVNEPGDLFVVAERQASETLDTISCSISSSEGVQNSALRHVKVKFGPTVRMQRAKIRAFDDLSAEITCIVDGFPLPQVHFKYNSKEINGQTRVRALAPHSYAHTFVIQNVTGRAGFYTCVGESGGEVKEANAELLVSTGLLPSNPRLIIDCCEKEGIEGDCLEVCSMGETRSHLNCSKYASSLLKCAVDNRDHGDCCVEKGVSSRCLPLCSGDSFSPNIDCSAFAVPIMNCFVRGHESAPIQPENLRFSSLGTSKIRVEWDHYLNDNSFVYYAVYYKRMDDDTDDYKVGKTKEEHLDLELDPSYKWDIGVTAANAYGHSPLAFIQVDTADADRDQHSSTFFPFLIFALIALVCGSVFYIGRRLNQSGTTVSQFLSRNQGVPHNDPTVAFENPGFGNDVGDEVEIRGLGRVEGADWQRNDLQAQAANGSNGVHEPTENTMRYSKLRV